MGLFSFFGRVSVMIYRDSAAASLLRLDTVELHQRLQPYSVGLAKTVKR